MEVQADVEISPLFLVNVPEPKDATATEDRKPAKIPGLNGPLTVTIEATANWENLGRDPVTKNFFLNE